MNRQDFRNTAFRLKWRQKEKHREKKQQDLRAATLLLPFRSSQVKLYPGPEELILGLLPFSVQFLHHTLLISASVIADHFQDDTKALTQADFLLPIFSFKHFDQYLTSQLKHTIAFSRRPTKSYPLPNSFFLKLLLFIYFFFKETQLSKMCASF